MINLPPATIDRAEFLTCCESLPDDVRERIAGAFPSYFGAAFVFPGDGMGDVTPNKPGPAKAREPKAETPIDKATLTATITKALALTPRLRAEDYAAALNSTDFGTRDAKVFGAAVKKALEALVSSKAAYCEGERRARRYWLAAKVEPEAAE